MGWRPTAVLMASKSSTGTRRVVNVSYVVRRLAVALAPYMRRPGRKRSLRYRPLHLRAVVAVDPRHRVTVQRDGAPRAAARSAARVRARRCAVRAVLPLRAPAAAVAGLVGAVVASAGAAGPRAARAAVRAVAARVVRARAVGAVRAAVAAPSASAAFGTPAPRDL
jgi:hypothetical protein